MKYFTKQWYNECQKESYFHISKKAKILAEELRKQNQRVLDEYQEYYIKIEPLLPDCIKNINMHDCRIVDSGFIGKNFHMNIDSSGGFCDLDKLTFVNAEILDRDIDLDGAWWLYDEIYIQPSNRYEMHILFHSKKRTLGEMVIVFDEIVPEKFE